MTKDQLIAFENDIAAEYGRGEISYPIHLSSGNEQALIDIFKEIRECDAIFGSWRFHLHCLLKGVPPDELRQYIRTGHSIALNIPKYKVFASAIVGGILPLAVGYALAIKRRGGSERVWCFLGDMTAHTGVYQECLQYSRGHSLPIQFIVEDNDLSVKTLTAQAWGSRGYGCDRMYRYQSRWPHSGIGKRVDF